MIADDAAVADPVRTCAVIGTSGATVLQVTPSRLAMLLQHSANLGGVRTLLIGGERLSPELAAAVHTLPGPAGQGLRAFNVYGPTETTIWSSFEPITTAPPGIGWPLPGEAMLIRSMTGKSSRLAFRARSALRVWVSGSVISGVTR